VCLAPSESVLGDNPIIGAATLYMWGRWVSFSERVMEMEGDMERFQLVASIRDKDTE